MTRAWRTGLLVIVLLPGRALAQQADEVERSKASFRAGATAYAAGEYLAAIQALDAAYALTPIAAIAFSLAQAERRQFFVSHERAHLDRAIALFRWYLEQVPSGGRRADALDALSQLEPLAAVLTGGGPQRTDEQREGEGSRRTRLMVTSETPGAELRLDDGPPAASPLIREVEPGQHRVQIAADGFYPDERQLMAIRGELIPEAVSLRARPSTVVVRAPSDAEIYVDGVFTTRGGDHVALELPSGSHRFAVAEKGHRVQTQSLELVRGQSHELRVTLERTGQRKAALVLLWSSAAALGTGAIFGALAVSAEKRAHDFLDRQAVGNVTSAELSDYESEKSARARDRVAAVVSLAASAGLFVTGALLYELDRPSSEEMTRPRSERSTLRFSPLALPGGGGAVFRYTF
jgi:tetratricopeptide (TPR) repeat protein